MGEEGDRMTFTKQLNTLLAAVRKVPGWDMAITYDLPDRPEVVVVHNGYRYGSVVHRQVVEDVVGKAPPKFVKILAKNIAEQATGTDDLRVLVRVGVDPELEDGEVYAKREWDRLPPTQQDEIMKNATTPIAVGRPGIFYKGVPVFYKPVFGDFEATAPKLLAESDPVPEPDPLYVPDPTITFGLVYGVDYTADMVPLDWSCEDIGQIRVVPYADQKAG